MAGAGLAAGCNRKPWGAFIAMWVMPVFPFAPANRPERFNTVLPAGPARPATVGYSKAALTVALSKGVHIVSGPRSKRNLTLWQPILPESLADAEETGP